jgi:hypothetical protein
MGSAAPARSWLVFAFGTRIPGIEQVTVGRDPTILRKLLSYK